MTLDIPFASLSQVAFRQLPDVWRRHCIDLAWEAHQAGSLPIAAVVTDDDGKILAQGRNRLAEHNKAMHLRSGG